MKSKSRPQSAGEALRRARVAELAYSYWEAEGRPEGRDLEHWLRAEAETPGPDPPEDEH